MQPIQIVVISPVAASPPAQKAFVPDASSVQAIILLLFCLLCITAGFAAFVVLGAVSSLAAHIAALVCVTLALGSIVGCVAQEVSEQWQTH